MTKTNKTFYLLKIENKNGDFHLRVEDTPGIDKHSLSNYAGTAGKRLHDGSNNMLPWIRDRFQWIYDNRANGLEQTVLASVEAIDGPTARTMLKPFRQQVVKNLTQLGYTKAA